MANTGGLRERKKQRTRRALLEHGLRLFDERGYDRTTVGDVCAAAEVAPATFFSYFPAKEDLVFADHTERIAAMRAIIEERAPGEPLRAVIMRGVDRLLSSEEWGVPSDDPLAAVRVKLIATVPALRAAALRRVFDVQAEWAEALAASFAGELDEFEAHALVGSLIGAAVSVAFANLRRGDGTLPMRAVVGRAVESTLAGLTH